MNTKRLSLIILLTLAALLLGACSGQPLVNTWPGLAADDERAYISTGSFIYAVDVHTGREIWRYPQEADGDLLFFASPVLTADGQLLIGSAGSTHPFISLDVESGTMRWSEPFLGAKGAWVAPPLVFNDTIYAPNTDGFLYILDLNGKPAADPIELGGALWSAPVTDGNLIYIASLDHHFHILDPQTLTLGTPIDLGGAAPGSPAVGIEGVYVGSFASQIRFIQPDGSNEVIAETGNWIWGAPAFVDDTLYYADLDGKIFSLDLSTRRQNWDAIQPDGPIVASPLVVGDHIHIVTESGSFLALDRGGKIVWEKSPGGQIYTAPVLSGDLILVAPYQAEFVLAAYDLEGKQAWTFVPDR